MNKSTGLQRISSGYLKSRSSWEAFLGCWKSQVDFRQVRDMKSGVAVELTSHMNIVNAGLIAHAEVIRKIENAEFQLKVELPPSFRDFQVATAGEGWYSDVDGYDKENDGLRRSLYSIRDIGYLSDVDSAALKIWPEDGFQRPSDDEYYRYGHGSGQLELAFDSSQLKHMIKIGGVTRGGLVLLNPGEVTKDGEMEVWILSPWHGLVRYLSFAEMIREMAYRDINDTGGFLIHSDKLPASPCIESLVIE